MKGHMITGSQSTHSQSHKDVAATTEGQRSQWEHEQIALLIRSKGSHVPYKNHHRQEVCEDDVITIDLVAVSRPDHSDLA